VLGIATIVSGGLIRHLPMRTRAIDDALTESIASGARQVILLGAGLDARAHRLEALESCTVFEVDHPDTQTEKRRAVRNLPILARKVRYVTVNFERDDLSRALRDAGHSPSEPSAIVWEGVTMYLEVPAIEATLRTVAELSAKGSRLMVTYQDMTRPPGWQLVRPVFSLVGEPLRTNFEPVEMNALLARHGFEVTSDEGDPEWSERFFAKTPRLSVSERLATARRA
jgi:methyltransferase (TIGR00027 family)